MSDSDNQSLSSQSAGKHTAFAWAMGIFVTGSTVAVIRAACAWLIGSGRGVVEELTTHVRREVAGLTPTTPPSRPAPQAPRPPGDRPGSPPVIPPAPAKAVPDTGPTPLNREAVQRFLKSRQRAFKSCYDREVQSQPWLSGKIVVTVTISPNGRPSQVAIRQDTLHSPGVAQCISRLMQAMQFPFYPDSDTTIDVPFKFVPG